MSSKKTVVLCEGRHDLIFLSLLLQRHNRKVLPRTWDDICGRSFYLSGERSIISNFLRKKEHSTVLLKQDENRDTCIKNFWIIYGYADPRYSLRAVLDYDKNTSPKNFNTERLKMNPSVSINMSSDYMCSLNTDSSSGVFYYPTSLTEEVYSVTGKNLNDFHDAKAQEAVLNEFLNHEPEWVGELEGFLINEVI